LPINGVLTLDSTRFASGTPVMRIPEARTL
jgi:hypothetical protein